MKRDVDKFISVDAAERTITLRSPRSPITFESTSVTLALPAYETSEGARRSAQQFVETWHRASFAAALDAVRSALSETPTFSLSDDARRAVEDAITRIDTMSVLRNDLS